MARKQTSLVLRVCRPDFTSRNGFVWPSEPGAVVSAPDWKNYKECGSGLHGWLYGQGEHDCVSYWQDADSKWLVLEVPTKEIVMLGGKCKFPQATVRFSGSRAEAAAFIASHEPKAKSVAIIGAVNQVGDKDSVLVGALGTATAGDSGTATAGNYGTATAGDSGEIRIQYWDPRSERYRTKIGYVGEDGIKPGVKYQLDENNEFKEV